MIDASCYISFTDSLKIWNLESQVSVVRFHVDIGANPKELLSKELQLKCN